jgi:uncharacterized protein YgbK (DUF1537 family)
MKINKEDLLNSLPPEWPEDLLPIIQEMVDASGTKIVVLDDDPTGTQTVHDVPVLTGWSRDALTAALEAPGAVVYVLTNSRSVPLAQAQAMNREIAENLKAASQATGRDFTVVSRSDSTLRGHYPGEVEALAQALEQPVDGTLIIPFFLEGGRLTAHDVHYVTDGEWLIPAAETEFARDASFGYQHSDLRAWVSEKHGGAIPPEAVASISISDLREGGPKVVAERLQAVRDGQVCVVNATGYRDMEVFVVGLLQAEAAGKRFIYRTAASFVRVRGGIAPRPLLTSAELASAGDGQGGLIVVGSHVRKSTLQMEAARELPGVTGIELRVQQLLDENERDEEVQRVVALANEGLAGGRVPLIYTSRDLVVGEDEVSALEIGQAVSEAVVAVVQGVTEEPAWVIAKGGITSSDVATQGLNIQRAEVLGQAIPGVPIWRTGSESRWPGLVYVVFPGNVGNADAVAEMVQILRGTSQTVS